MDLQELTAEITAFRDERDWAQFHTPRNVGAALAVEAAELQQEMLWKTDAEVAELLDTGDGHGRVSDEIADVLIYALLFCEAAGVDPVSAIRTKLEKNAEKYPIDLARGTAAKYDDLDQ
jgi:NTP pyrophosphatase (non-canonical NTP hydrolase)